MIILFTPAAQPPRLTLWRAKGNIGAALLAREVGVDQDPKEILRKPRQLEPGFDTGQELWERLVDDVIERGGPCLETVEQLVEQACRLPANGGKPAGSGGED